MSPLTCGSPYKEQECRIFYPIQKRSFWEWNLTRLGKSTDHLSSRVQGSCLKLYLAS